MTGSFLRRKKSHLVVNFCLMNLLELDITSPVKFGLASLTVYHTVGLSPNKTICVAWLQCICLCIKQ